MRDILQPLLTLCEGDSQAASLMSLFSFHCASFAIASFNLHCAPEYGQHFAALSNMLRQLYARPSGARSLSPSNLPNYASHQLFSRSIAVIPEPHTLTLCPSFSGAFFLSVHLLHAFHGFLSQRLISSPHYLSPLLSPTPPLPLSVCCVIPLSSSLL